jgi:transcriptional regulator with XRE-family HTH domain
MRGFQAMHDRAAKVFANSLRSQPLQHAKAAAPSIHPVDLHVGQQLRIRRIHSNLSQTELGHEMGLSYQQIQKYESGKNRISASMLYEFAGRLNVPVSRFFEGLPQPGSQSTHSMVADVDNRIAYIATAEGRRFVDEILRLPPRLRTRTFALVKTLAENEEDRGNDGSA